MRTPLRVLVVEDSADDAILLMRALRDGGYEPTWEQVETAEAMTAALQKQTWDIVLSDYVLPQFGALDALQILRDHQLDFPFFVVSGHISEETAAAAMKAGARDYLMKDNLTRLIPAIARELQDAQDRQVQRKSKEHFQALVENAFDLMIVLTADGIIQYVSRSCEWMLGYESEKLIGSSFFTYVHPEDEAAVQEPLHHILRQPGISSAMKFRFRSAKDEWRILEASSALLPEGGPPPQAILNARDVTEREAQTAALKHQSRHDALTGLPNRMQFNEAFAETIQAAKERSGRLTLLYLDLDRFREVNDTFGYRWGDVVLQQVAPRLQGALRKTDVIARLSGDEFVILLPSVYDTAGATRLARRLLQVLESPFLIEGHKVSVSASIGIVIYPDHGTDTETLVRRADMSMHLAKSTGSGYAFYTPEQEDRYNPNRLVLISDLRQAIEDKQLVLYYQPKAHIATGTVAQVEALARWRHPEKGLIAPDRFIPLAEQTGLIRGISRWALSSAIQQCHLWQEEGIDLHLAVNLSMRDLQDVQIPEIIANFLHSWRVSPSCLEVEITETAIAADTESAVKILTELRRMGLSVAIDDFGTGYSSLAHLRRLPLNTIKIDKSFVKGLTTDENDAAIVRATIQLGHNLGLSVVAEGVEDQETWDALAHLGCDIVQGYFLSRPVPAADFARWLRDSPWGQKSRIAEQQSLSHEARRA
ncbi:MAG: putative bifunctional diguanylate cyclase/phosphodiesterase [Candidatus Binatia bacterium]